MLSRKCHRHLLVLATLISARSTTSMAQRRISSRGTDNSTKKKNSTLMTSFACFSEEGCLKPNSTEAVVADTSTEELATITTEDRKKTTMRDSKDSSLVDLLCSQI